MEIKEVARLSAEWLREHGHDFGCSVPAERGVPRRGLTYLAAPYSHPDPLIRDMRISVINLTAARLMREGVLIFSPISHTHPIAVAGGLPLGWEFWEAYDREVLSHCCRVLVLRLPGWEESKGVTAEIEIARELGIPVEYVDP